MQNMTDEQLDLLLQRAGAYRLCRALAALPEEASLRAAWEPLKRLDRRMARSLRALRKRQAHADGMPRHISWRTAKRVALVALLAASVLCGTLVASAELRLTVKNTIVEWMERNMSIRYEVEGKSLSALPEGYGPHYMPAGFSYCEDESFSDEEGFVKIYRDAQGNFISLEVWLATDASVTQNDTEHTQYEHLDYGDGDAWLGTFDDGDGYIFDWVKEGIEHHLYINAVMDRTEVFQIAGQVY